MSRGFWCVFVLVRVIRGSFWRPGQRRSTNYTKLHETVECWFRRSVWPATYSLLISFKLEAYKRLVRHGSFQDCPTGRLILFLTRIIRISRDQILSSRETSTQRGQIGWRVFLCRCEFIKWSLTTVQVGMMTGAAQNPENRVHGGKPRILLTLGNDSYIRS
jgi:hypothetical protein